MKKIFCIFSLILCMLLLSTACSSGDGDSSDSSGVFWTGGTDIYFVLASDAPAVPSALDSAVYDLNGRSAVCSSDTKEVGAHEIIIGNTSRDLSKKAYRLLERITETEKSGYVIYSDGKSVAIAYSCNEALVLAAEDFVNNWFVPVDGKIELKSGTLANHSFDLYAYYNQLDKQLRDTQWAELEKYINKQGYDGAETVAAFKKLYTLYSDKAYIWLANLWDPVTGGFYYSNSGRDTVTFAPDLESTRQAIDLLRYSGMTTNIMAELPVEMQESMITFVRSLYDENTGYYLHPQWENYVTTDERLGRDVTNAKAILGAFGATQASAAADITTNILPASAYLTGKLGASSVRAVSKVVATATPAHLASKAAFLDYLHSQNWNDSYTSGNRIAAQSYLIDQNGLMEVCLDFFDSIQNPETGMWSQNRDDDAVNGFLKISAVYADYGPKYKRTINYASEAADTCIQVLLSTVEPHTVCWVYNVWYSLGNIIGLLNSSASAADKTLADDIRARLRKDAALYITTAYEKYLPFLKDDGSFSFTPKTSSPESQGMPVCVQNMNEGDVNATYISIISVSGRIFSALGYKNCEVSVYTPNDFKVFVDTVTDLGEIVKTNLEFGGALGFTGETLTGAFYETNRVDTDTKPDEVDYAGYAYAYIAQDNGENVLCYGKEDVSVGFEPYLSLRLVESGGTRYTFETKIKFNGAEMQNDSWHTKFSMYGGSGRFWYLLAYTLADGSLALGSRNEPLATLSPDKWYTLRFEYYTDSSDNPTDKICKIYVDGKYVGDGGTAGQAGRDSAYYKMLIEFRAAATNVEYMLDNVMVTTDNEAYVAPPPPDFGDATGTYYTDATIKSKRFDYDAEEPILPNTSSGGSAELAVENGTLIFAKKTENQVSAEDYIHFSNDFGDAFWSFGSRVTVVEFDLNYSGISVATPMKWRFGKDIVVSRSGSSLSLSYTYNGNTTKAELDIAPGEWNNIRLEQYWYRKDASDAACSIIKVFVNDIYKGELVTNYDSATYNFYIYLLKAETEASLTIDNLLLAHIDKAYVSEEPETPDTPNEPDTPDTPTEPEVPAFDPGDATGDYYKDNENKSGTRVDYDAENVTLPSHSGALYTTLQVKDGELELARISGTSGEGAVQWNVNSFTGIVTPVLIFEADVRFEDFSATTVGKLLLNSNDRQLQLTVNHSGNEIILFHGSTGNSVKITEGEACNLRFEVDYENSDVNIFVNNEYKGSISDVSFSSNTGTRKIVFYLLSSETTGKIYLDNLFFGVLEDGSELPAPETPKEDDATGNYYKNKEISGTRIDYDEDGTAAPSGSNASMNGDASLKLSDGALVHTTSTLGNESSFRWIVSKDSSLTTPVLVFETDIRFTGLNATTFAKLLLCSCDKQVQITLSHSGDTVTLTSANGGTGSVVIPENEWVNLRFEVDYSAAVINVFVNNEYVHSFEEISFTNAVGSTKINYYFLKSETAGCVAFDNVFYGLLEDGTSISSQN